ncbi:hypothetical protein SAMN05660657_03540 [Geodermatophilus amargosae]|uniref:Uncharacterized protein n=1 Tax=Geodermatophilus amargosae TaxID=1296565 RepID=A0A1I7BG06_9ACTN|nr:hypothetical protein [Geodermatophilus amargosae]SFT86104.1 hypothetical protein SAMN05660657_03540 [Geodermatophilus amargosae]
MQGDTRTGLLETIRDRRAAIEVYVREKEPASRRLLTISIVSSALAAALTAGPAFGGEPFAETVRAGLSLDRPSKVWGLLCLGALVVSVTAAVSAQLDKSHDLRSRIGAAEAAGVMLDGLRTRLEFGGMSIPDAAQEYQDILAGIPFVHESSADPTGDPQGDGGFGSTRRRARLRGWQFGIVAVLAALLLAATLVGYVRGLAGPADGDPGTTSTPTVSGTPNPSPSPSPSVQEAVFAGRTGDGRASLAIVVLAGRASAYLCDGRELEAWLEGSVDDGRLDLTDAAGTTLTGTVDGDTLAGDLVAPTLSTRFVATVATEPAGVYRARTVIDGVEALIRWVVLPDWSQVGITNLDGAPSDAPPLQLPGGTFTTADGTTHRAERISP